MCGTSEDNRRIADNVAEVLPDESLKTFLAAIHDFNQTFVDALVAGVDFTIKLEVRGNQGELLHAKKDDQSWRRPKGTEEEYSGRRRGH